MSSLNVKLREAYLMLFGEAVQFGPRALERLRCPQTLTSHEDRIKMIALAPPTEATIANTTLNASVHSISQISNFEFDSAT